MFDAADFAQHEMDRGRDEQDRLTYERERDVPEVDGFGCWAEPHAGQPCHDDCDGRHP